MTITWPSAQTKPRLFAVSFCSLVICLAFFLLGTNSLGGESYSEDDMPFGTSLEVWMNRWWTWWIATDANEATPKPDGCIINKNNSMIMLMDTTVSGRHQQVCEISSGQGIIVPMWTAEWEASVPEDMNKTYQELSMKARAMDLGKIVSSVKLDGVRVATLDVSSGMQFGQLEYKITSMDNVTELYSKGFNITIPVDTHYPDMNTGTWRSGAHGWFVFLKPLDLGDHKLEYGVTVTDSDNPVSTELTYILKVKNE